MKTINLTTKRVEPDGSVSITNKTTDYDFTLWMMCVSSIAAEYRTLVEYNDVETMWYNNDVDNLPDEVSFSVEFKDGSELEKAVMRE